MDGCVLVGVKSSCIVHPHMLKKVALAHNSKDIEDIPRLCVFSRISMIRVFFISERILMPRSQSSPQKRSFLWSILGDIGSSPERVSHNYIESCVLRQAHTSTVKMTHMPDGAGF